MNETVTVLPTSRAHHLLEWFEERTERLHPPIGHSAGVLEPETVNGSIIGKDTPLLQAFTKDGDSKIGILQLCFDIHAPKPMVDELSQMLRLKDSEPVSWKMTLEILELLKTGDEIIRGKDLVIKLCRAMAGRHVPGSGIQKGLQVSSSKKPRGVNLIELGVARCL